MLLVTTDKAYSQLSGYVNSQHTGTWSDENLHAVKQIQLHDIKLGEYFTCLKAHSYQPQLRLHNSCFERIWYGIMKHPLSSASDNSVGISTRLKDKLPRSRGSSPWWGKRFPLFRNV